MFLEAELVLLIGQYKIYANEVQYQLSALISVYIAEVCNLIVSESYLKGYHNLDKFMFDTHEEYPITVALPFLSSFKIYFQIIIMKSPYILAQCKPLFSYKLYINYFVATVEF